MKNLGLRTRLISSVAILTALMVGVALLGYRGIHNAEAQLTQTYAGELLPLRQLKAVSDSLSVEIVGHVRRAASELESMRDARDAIGHAQERAVAAWSTYLAGNAMGPERTLADEAGGLISRSSAAITRAREIMDRGDLESLRAFERTELARAIDPVFAKLEQLSEFQRSAAADKIAAIESDEQSLKVEMLVTGAVAVIIAVGLGFLLARVARDLSALVAQVQGASVQVGASVTEIAATAKEQEATANEIAATTAEIGATSKEISATSKDLVKTMSDVAAGAEQTATLADSGHGSLERMEEMMRQVVEAAGSINAKLAVLNEKAGNINQVVTTITKVADQTNLLSLNASIEAEKAGEYGRGFAVVATEIRRLADQTAVATYDIEQIVKEMLSAVSASVMGMDKFSEEVRRGVGEVRTVSAQLTRIIEQVQTLTPRFETVNEGMQAQATGAQQISEALGQLSEAAQQTVESLRQSNLAMDQLNETAQGLRQSVAQIKV